VGEDQHQSIKGRLIGEVPNYEIMLNCIEDWGKDPEAFETEIRRLGWITEHTKTSDHHIFQNRSGQ
jgi:hypothetical protein